MANYTTSAINLRTYNINEADKIVHLYSRDKGLLKCVAKGVKKSKSRLGGKMDVFIANNLYIAKGKSLDVICQADLIEGFTAIKKDYTKLSYAFYCAELISAFALENDPNSFEIYDTFFEALKNISSSDIEMKVIWNMIKCKLKLMEYIGYDVQTDFCVSCNDVTELFSAFCIERGGVVCNSCKKLVLKTDTVNDEIINIIKSAKASDFSNDKFSCDMIIFTFNILKDYVSFRTNKKLKTPDMIGMAC